MENDIATLWATALDPMADGSLQRQLHTRVRGAILSGELRGGSRLPASRALAARLGVARITVVQAYDQLVAEGYLETRTGAGTFVTSGTPDMLIAGSTDAQPAPPYKSDPPRHIFLSGMPALDQFPAAKWARTVSRAARQLDTRLMYHREVMGYAPLRENIADYLRASRSVVCDPSQIILVSGLQQGLYLLVNAALKPDATIIMEDPGFDGMLAAAQATGRNIEYTGVDESGAVTPDDLSGLLVTSPSRQYPLGHTMRHNRRLELLAWARATDSLIFEDDYDSEFRYAGRPLNSLQGIDGGERVIYGGTFSKSLFPALRLGYLVLPRHLVEPVKSLRAAIDSFPSIASQQALNAFMDDGEFTRHIRRLRKVHARRKAIFEMFATKYLDDFLDFQRSDAGLHLLALSKKPVLASNLKDEKLANMAQKQGIGAVPLSRTYRKSSPRQGLLVGFANMADDEIEVSLQRLAADIAQQTGFAS